MHIFSQSLHLFNRGYYIGPRDPNRNSNFTGEWMVCADPNYDRPTEDAGAGGYCVVGDDLDVLIRDAYDYDANCVMGG